MSNRTKASRTAADVPPTKREVYFAIKKALAEHEAKHHAPAPVVIPDYAAGYPPGAIVPVPTYPSWYRRLWARIARREG